MTRILTKTALVSTFTGLGLAFASPAAAADIAPQVSHTQTASTLGDMSFEHKRKRHKRHYRDDYRYSDRGHRTRYYDEPVYRDTRIWRANDGRYYCRKRDGTTGLLIGAGVGGLIGHEVAGRGGDRTLGAILGAAGGAILGRAIDRSDSRCR